MRSFKMFVFGIRVFFNNITFNNIIQILRFSFKRYLLGKRVPVSAVFALTYRCQCSCVHCSVGDYMEKEEIDSESAKKIIFSLKKFGVLKITFFGGEPLLRKDIVELVSFASKLGLRTSIDTNGIFINDKLVSELKKAGIGNINVSIDSSDPRIHDFLRKYDGCFEKAVNAIKICVKNNIPVIISTYASKRALNSGDLEKIIDLGKKLKVKGVKILFPILSGKWRKKEEELLNDSETSRLMGLTDPAFVYIEDALEMVKSNSKGCSALRGNLIYISPTGEVQPCPAVPLSFGNVRDKNIEEILSLMEYKFSLKYSGKSGCIMNDGEFRKDLFIQKDTYPLKCGDK